jgi:aspartate/methionine/tyrosine aminotransferase
VVIGPKDAGRGHQLQSHQTSNVCNVAQRAALAAVAGDLEAVAMMRAAFERRGRAMHRMLQAIPGVTCIEPQGAFYCFPSFKGVLGREVRGHHPTTTLDLAAVILIEGEVAPVPGGSAGRRPRPAQHRPRRRRLAEGVRAWRTSEGRLTGVGRSGATAKWRRGPHPRHRRSPTGA